MGWELYCYTNVYTRNRLLLISESGGEQELVKVLWGLHDFNEFTLRFRW